MTRPALVLALLCAWIFSGRAAAQTPDPLQLPVGFLAYLESDYFHDYLAAKVLELEPAPLAARCGAMHMIRRQGWSPVEAPIWDDNRQRAIAGSWIERVVIERCGEISLRRFLMSGRRDGDPTATALVPGGTLANLSLERSVLPLIGAAARVEAECNDARRLFIVDTRVVELPKADGWIERWTAMACDTPVVQDIRFASGPDGVTAQSLGTPGR